jgi:hypothetical protein
VSDKLQGYGVFKVGGQWTLIPYGSLEQFVPDRSLWKDGVFFWGEAAESDLVFRRARELADELNGE